MHNSRRFLSSVFKNERNRLAKARQAFFTRFALTVGARYFGTVRDVPWAVPLDNRRELVMHVFILPSPAYFERLAQAECLCHPHIMRESWPTQHLLMSAMQNDWPRIAVVGAGAVGCYFGGMLARAGAPVTLIGRAPHVDAIRRRGLFLDSLHFQEQVPVSAATDLKAVHDADVVLICVKTLDTEEAAKALALDLAPGARVISLQNGVDNVDRIRSATGIDAIPAVVYVACAMTEAGHVKHSGRGDLIIGELPKHRTSGLEALAAMFVRAGVPCRISENIDADLWTKLIMNCAYNAISALSRAKYGRIAQTSGTRELMRRIIIEAVAVARAAGIQLSEAGLIEAALKLGVAMSEATSSTAQDISRGKRTEIDSLNGYVVRRGAEVGVPTPVNQTLHSLVKLLEGSSGILDPGHQQMNDRQG
jgi:2-dehydropantoate 2-reductase